MKMSTRKIAFAAMIGAVYAALTIALAPISYGPVQFRISEVMCILPFFFPFSVWGLFGGCILANLLSAYGLADIVFGSLATLLAGLCTMYCGRYRQDTLPIKVLACFPPVFFNGVIIGAVISFAVTPGAFFAGFLINGLQVAAGEFAVLYLLGLPALIWLPRTKLFKKLMPQLERTDTLG